MKYTDSDTKFDDVHYKNSEKFGDVSFSIRNIQHPHNYGRWNYNVRLRPSIHFDKERYEAVSTSGYSDEEIAQMPEVRIRRLLTFANLKTTAHTPVGAFVLTGGLGVALSERRNDGNYVHTATKKVSKLDLVWVGFFAKRFFLMAGPRYYHEDYEQFVFAFRLGFFWGDPYSS